MFYEKEKYMIYLMMIDDEEDKRKFVIIYEKYRYLMMKIAFEILEDTFLAEDVVHEAFIKVAKNIVKIGSVEATETKRYLLTITKTTAIDIYRKRNLQFKREMFVDELSEKDMPLTYMETDVDGQILDILSRLPVKYRDVFLLKYSSEMNNREIAKILDISEGTIRQRLARGKIIIQEEINRFEERKNNGAH